MNPREQVLTKTDLAKSENAWRELPHVVSKGAQKNFMAFADYVAKAWEASADSFHEDYFRAAVGRVTLFRSLEKIVSAQPWYSGGYRANVVAYSMAKLAHSIRIPWRPIVDLGHLESGIAVQCPDRPARCDRPGDA